MSTTGAIVKDEGLTPAEYSAKESFNFVHAPTGVSYCDVGDPNGIPTLILPGSSMAAHLTAVLFHGNGKARGLRVICIDKPGFGKAPVCRIDDRVQTYTKSIDAILTDLGIVPTALISISSGFIYALYLLAHKPNLVRSPPTLLALTPWINYADSPSLGIISHVPSALVGIVPAVLSVAMSPAMQSAFSFSSSISSAITRTAGSVAEVDIEQADAVGIYESSAAIKLALAKTTKAPGYADELRLCLRNGKWGFKDYPQILALIPRGFRLRTYCGGKDGLVPRKAQTRFSGLFVAGGQFHDSVDFRELFVPEGGHNDTASMTICWDDITNELKNIS